MSDFDAEEYEEFDLGADGQPRTTVADRVDADDLDDDDDDDDDEIEDAAEEDIDFVLAAYREDGQPVAQALAPELANDLEELIVQLRRLPADAGSLGFVGLVEEVLVIVRVRGQHVQVLLSDGTAANDWPIARDVADLLGAEIPDVDDDAEPLGDLGLLRDMGLSELDLGAILDDFDLSSDQMLLAVVDKLKMGPQVQRALDTAYGS